MSGNGGQFASLKEAFPEVDWVVFDVTGTLLRPHPSPAEAYRTIASQFGYPIAPQIMQQRIREAMQRHFGPAPEPPGKTLPAKTPPAKTPGGAVPLRRPATDEARERERWQRIVQDALPELEAGQQAAAFATLWEHFRQAAHWEWVPGVRPLIEAFQAAKQPLAVATNFDARVRTLLDEHPPLDQIATRFLSSEVGFSKPDPRFFERVAAGLGVEPPRLLMIGDDPLNDLAGAEAAGWQTRSIEAAVAALDR